ncbi:MAG: hypothetical protein WA816_12825 [Bacteroidales bacterium]
MKSSVWILSFFLCYGLNAQKGSLNLSHWHVSDKINMSEFQLIRRLKLQYLITNDNVNIYIDLKINDHGVQDRILRQGLTIWINMDGTEMKKMGIRFPLGSQNQGDRKKANHSENNSISNESDDTLVLLANTIELKGFTNEVQRHFPSDNRDNFRGSVKFDAEGVLNYELVIPIEKLPVRNSRGGHGAMPFTLGIEYGSSAVINKQEVNRGPRPSSLFRSGSSGSDQTKLYWIHDVKLATSR